MNCLRCGYAHATGRFCSECGSRIDATSADTIEARLAYTPPHLAEKILRNRSALEGERKHVTVLFCDICDSTSLAARLGAERIHQLLSVFFESALREVHRFEGTINQFLGDGFMALFGAPIAHEDHARRAVMAAVAIRDAVAGLAAHEGAAALRLRIGLNSGLVVVGGIGDNLRMDYTASGDTTHLASRLQDAAAPGTILISGVVHQATHAYIDHRLLPPLAVKGKDELTVAYELLGLRKAGAVGPPQLPSAESFLGRQAEIAEIGRALLRLQAGTGGVVALVGDAGVGKSRLMEEACRLAREQGLRWLRGDCLSFGRTLSYWAFREVFRAGFGIDETDDPAQSWGKMDAGLRELFGHEADELLPFIGTLLAMPLPEAPARRLNALDSAAVGHQIFRTTRLLCERTAQQRPLILAFEDWQWADASSADLLEHLLALSDRVSILFIVTTRPEPQGPAESLRIATSAQADPPLLNALTLRIGPLQTADSLLLAERLLGGALPVAVRDMLLRRSDGNPFYLGELVRALLATHAIERHPKTGEWHTTPAFDTVPLPDTIEGLILARIDRLDDEAKQVLKVAAVVGSTFSCRVLKAVTDADPALDDNLVKLRIAKLITEKQALPELEYMFQHPLIQQATYDSMLEERRRSMHARVGQCIECLFEGRLEPFYSTLAYHFAKAEDPCKAQEYLLKAADQAGRIAADAEALEHYRATMLLLKRRASNDANTQKQAQLDWRIGEALYRLGHYDDSLLHLLAALEALGLRYPSGRRAVVLAIARRLLSLGWRRLLRRRDAYMPPDAVPAAEPAVSSAAVVEAVANIDYHRDPLRFLLDVLILREEAERSARPTTYAIATGALGAACDAVGLFGVAERLHREAVDIGRRLGDAKTLGYAYMLYGLHAYSTGHFVMAHDRMTVAVERFRSAGDLRQWAGATGLRMFVLRTMGDPRWIGHIDPMLEVAEASQDDQARGWSMGWLAERHLVAEEFASAAALLERACAMAHALGDYRAQAADTASGAWILVHQGRTEQAMPLLEQVEAILDEHRILGVVGSLAIVRTAEAYLHAAEAEVSPARRRALLSRARRACARVSRHARLVHDDSAAEALRLRGIDAWLSGRPKRAAALWRKGLDVAERMQANCVLSKLHFEFGQRLGDPAHMAKARALSGRN